MKKFMRIALVFALAGATLVGCTKDYSGDISDLNKKVSEQSAAVTALQTAVSNAQAAADAAASTANTALSTAKAAATADELNAVKAELAKAATADALKAVDDKYAAYIPAIEAAAKAADLEALETAVAEAIAKTNVSIEDLKAALATKADKAEFDAAVERILALETNYITLEARVAALEAADEEIQKLVDANAKGIEANAEDIAALQKLVEALTAQLDGAFSVDFAQSENATYASATWEPGTTKAEKDNLAKLVKVFPELAELKKGDKVETFGHLNFIVNPSSIVLNDSYAFALVGADGKDRNVVLGNPTKGFATKAGLNVWNVEVQSPAYDEEGDEITENDKLQELALVVENADGVFAQTGFNYTVSHETNTNAFSIEGNVYPFTFDDTKTDHSFDAIGTEKLFDVTGGLFKFIIEADPADVEDFGIEIEGSKISFTKTPKEGEHTINFAITAVNVAGKTATLAKDDQAAVVLTYEKSVAPNAKLADKEITLGYNETTGHDVVVKYDVADFEFSASEWKQVYAELQKTTTTAIAKYESNDYEYKYETEIVFFNAAGAQISGETYSKVAAFGFVVESDDDDVVPGTYTVEINAGQKFYGKGDLTIQNPEVCPVKLIDALCKDGVLQIVGDVKNGNIEYALENAILFDRNEATITAVKPFCDEDQTSSDKDNWVENGTTFVIPVANADQNLLYTNRNLSVEFNWFGNANNPGKFEFKAQAVSPIYAEGGKNAVTIDTPQTIYVNETATESNTFNVNAVVSAAKYVAGDKVNKPYNVFQLYTAVGKSDKTPIPSYVAQPSNYSTFAKAQFGAQVLHEYQDETGASSAYSAAESTGNDDIRKYTFKSEEISVLDAAITASQYIYRSGSNYNRRYYWINEGTTFTTLLPTTTPNRYMVDNGGKYIKVNTTNENILRGFGLNENEVFEVVTSSNVDLFLTESMYTAAYDVWSKYYDVSHNELSAKTVDAGTIWYETFKSYADNTIPNWNEWVGTFELFKESMKTTTKQTLIDVYHIAEANIEKLSKVVDSDDNNAIAAFDSIRYSFEHIIGYKDDAKPAHWELTADRASEINKVEVGFVDAVLAAKFIAPLDGNQFKYEIPLKGDEVTDDPNFYIKSNGNEFEAGRTSVTLPAYLKISDNWGMTMTIPFDVVVKTNTK